MIFTTLLCIFISNGQTAKDQAAALSEVRNAHAIKYLDPEGHMAIAKHFHDQGNRLLAFYLLETARRTRFERKDFDPAFASVFRGVKPFDNSKAAEEKLLAKHKQDAIHAETLFGLADIYVSRGDWKNAKTYLNQLIAVRPADYENYDGLAEVYRQEGNKKKADEITQGFFTKYPESVEAFTHKIAALAGKDDAQAKSVLAAALMKHPKNANFWFEKARLLQEDGKPKDAEDAFVKAADLDKSNAHIQGWVGRFFLRARPNEAKSLHYYLNAYFLDPHFYDSEFAESRIRKLNYTEAEAIYTQAQKDGRKIEDLVAHENPVVVGLVLAKLAEPWNVKNAKHFVAAMRHDDPIVRSQALEVLLKSGDQSLDKDIESMLAGNDLRLKGLACYLAVKFWKAKGIDAVRPLLNEKAQLVRFDAISALALHGGAAGKKIVAEHRQKETHPRLVQLLKSIDKAE